MIQFSPNIVMLAVFAILPACSSLEDQPVVENRNDASVTNASMATYVQDEDKVKPGPVDKDAAKEFTTTKSGLKYRIRRKSDGKKPVVTDTVTVHYKGWLDSGKEFDSSYKRGETTSFPLNRVVAGWTEGLQLCPVGGMIELEIPAKLGYGDRGIPQAGIPPNATLHFLVELKSIK